MQLKHKTTGEIIQYENGIMKSGNTCIEGTPNMEFWEEVNKESFIVLSYYLSTCLIQNTGGYSIQRLYEMYISIPVIHSVKRLSDGEVFTLGDTITGGKVKAIVFLAEDIFLWFIEGGSISLNSAKKLNTTVVQGKEVTEEQKFYVLHCKGSWDIFESRGGHYKKEKDWLKKFLKFEDAEEYRLLNKPCLSIKDVVPIFGQMPLDNSRDRMTEKLKNLVKSKELKW